MSALGSLKRTVGRLVTRPGSPSQPPGAFYPQVRSCQIPDLWFLYSRLLGDRTDGTFVEVGAHDGVSFSNTWGLAERGWRGLMIEPVPALAERCRRNHREHPGVAVVELGIGAEDGATLRLHLADTLTTANDAAFREYRSVRWASGHLTEDELVVPSTTLDSLLSHEHVPCGFEVLVVDVEGFEEQVFGGFDLARWAPRMVIVELADLHPDLAATAVSDARLSSALTDEGYRIVYKDRVNTVFVAGDTWARAFSHDPAATHGRR